jgi:hypothetical protein
MGTGGLTTVSSIAGLAFSPGNTKLSGITFGASDTGTSIGAKGAVAEDFSSSPPVEIKVVDNIFIAGERAIVIRTTINSNNIVFFPVATDLIFRFTLDRHARKNAVLVNPPQAKMPKKTEKSQIEL